VPSHVWHDGKKVHDYNASQVLFTDGNFLDWEVVTLFYSAMHYVDSYLDRAQGIDIIYNHLDRKALVRLYIPIINRTYKSLYNLSRNARYDDVPIGMVEMATAKANYEEIKLRLTPKVCTKCGAQNLLNSGKCDKCGAKL